MSTKTLKTAGAVLLLAGGLAATAVCLWWFLLWDAARCCQRGAHGQAMGRYRAALTLLPQSHRVRFNLGTCLYRSGDYSAAYIQFRALLTEVDGELLQRAMFSAANSVFRLAQGQWKLGQPGSQQLYREAIDLYDRLLARNPADGSARHNRSVAQRWLQKVLAAQAASGGRPQGRSDGQRSAANAAAGHGRRDDSFGVRNAAATAGAAGPAGTGGREAPSGRADAAGAQMSAAQAENLLREFRLHGGVSVQLNDTGRSAPPAVERDW